MSDTMTSPQVCVVCNNTENLVPDIDIERIHDTLYYAEHLVDLGEVKWKSLADYLSSLSKAEMEKVR